MSFNENVDWIRVARDGDIFTVVGTGGNTETMNLAEFNSLLLRVGRQRKDAGVK